MKLRLNQALASSLFFIGFGAIVLWLSSDMQIGTAAEMGVGYVPWHLGLGSILVGAISLVLMRLGQAPAESVAVEIRPLVYVPVLIACFAFLLPVLGLPVTVGLLVLATLASGEDFDWRWLLLTAIALAAGTAVLFVVLLQLQIPLWPTWRIS